MKTLFSLLAITFFSLAAIPPAKADSRVYRVFKQHIFDIDSWIEKSLKIKTISCSFQGKKRKAESTNGLGYCLFVNFFEARKTNEIPGLVQAQIMPTLSEPGTPPLSIEVTWRPVYSHIETDWIDFLTGRILINKYREYRLLYKNYLQNDLVIESKEGIPIRALFGKTFAFSNQLGQDARIHKMELHFSPAPDKQGFWMNASFFEAPQRKPKVVALLKSDSKLFKKGNTRTRITGRVDP